MIDEINLPCRNLGMDICPWALPFIAKSLRDPDFRLRAYGIPAFTFGEQLHPLLNQTKYEAACYWSENLKLIPIHQDVTISHIELIKRAFGKILEDESLFDKKLQAASS